MHEMSVVTGMMKIIREEMTRHNVKRLLLVKVRCGVLCNVVPEALTFAFEALTAGTDLEGARIELDSVPVQMACRECGTAFQPAEQEGFYLPCPQCGNRIGHRILSGNELYIEYIQAE